MRSNGRGLTNGWWGSLQEYTRQNVEAFQWLHDLRWKERLAAGTNEERGGADARTSIYATGTTSMMLDSTAALGKWKTDARVDWAIAPMPRGACGLGEWSAMDGYTIPAGTRNPDAAWTVLDALSSKDAHKMRAEIAWLGPARKSQFTVWGKLLPERNMKYAVPTDGARPDPNTLWPRAAEVEKAITPLFTRLFDENAISVPDALKQIVDAINGVLGAASAK